MDKSLRTWRLTPSKDSDLWSQSNYRGEVWVRAHDAVEARKLTAHRFRVRPHRSERRARMESPWYVRELTRCEVDENPRFDSIEIPCVAWPTPDEKTAVAVANTTTETPVIAQDPATDAPRRSTGVPLQGTFCDVVALDVRRAIVALLIAKDIQIAGRWLDVYATTAADNAPIFVIVPAPKLKRLIAEELASLIDHTLDDQQTSWILSSADVERLLGGNDGKLQAA